LVFRDEDLVEKGDTQLGFVDLCVLLRKKVEDATVGSVIRAEPNARGVFHGIQCACQR
jgi:hypothetical protein